MSRARKKKLSFKDKLLSPAALELVAARFRVLAEPMRLALLNALRRGEKTVSELVAETDAGQANVSKHLGILADAGMVGPRKHGLNVYNFIADKTLFALCDLVCARLRTELSEKAAKFM
jgi:DNA-binding transcriptional ArsR family regulator